MRDCKKSDTKNHRPNLMGKPVVARSVTKCASLDEVFEHSLPAFGGALLRRFYLILKEVILRKIPLVITVAGPITVSDQHRAWLIPLLKSGCVAYITVTDAIVYHDAHDCLGEFAERPIREVDLWGDDAEYRKQGIIRVTDTGFPEKILFDQDRMVTAILRRPEFQRSMTTTERNHLFGRYYAAQERKTRSRPGLISTCYRLGIPVFVGAPADGSVFLNSVKLWAMSQSGGEKHGFQYDLQADVFEACAYHYWGLFESEAKALAVLILGGGVPKNYSLQPEPTLSQILLLDGIRGYDFDVQIVSSPVTDGSLSSCFPAEAVSWGKVNPETFHNSTESLQADYSMIMPFVVRALYEASLLKRQTQLRLYNRKSELVKKLMNLVWSNRKKLEKTLNYPLALVARAKQ